MITRWNINELNHSEEGLELYHHGVLGMRWGHRKQQPASSVSNSRAARRKRIIRNVAIGAGAAAAVGAGLYIAKKKGLIGKSPVSRTVGTLKVGKPPLYRSGGRKYIYKPAANTPLAKGNRQKFNIPSSGGIKRLISKNASKPVKNISMSQYAKDLLDGKTNTRPLGFKSSSELMKDIQSSKNNWNKSVGQLDILNYANDVMDGKTNIKPKWIK